WSSGYNTIYGNRNYVMMNEDGEWLAYADSKWVLIDIDTRMPARITDKEMEGYVIEERIDMPESNKRLKLSSDREQMPNERVYKTYIDTNGHMNNTAYFRLAQEFIPNDLDYDTIDAVYVKETTEGTIIVPFIHKEEKGIGISFEGEDGTVFTKIKIYKED
ncbi:MAG: hypothetical protein IKN54_05955, partial [Lachnospiraceae bacterium]|nr:hypothetical protein [Lachnospiraceae bacterium]